MTQTSVSLLERARAAPASHEWERLAEVYAPLLHAWLRRYQLQSSDVDDLVQEVLLTLSRELPTFDHSGRTGAFRSWLKRILVNRLRNFWRARNRGPRPGGGSGLVQELAELEDDASRASRIWDAEHDRHVLARLLMHVKPRFQPRTWEAFERQMFRGESPKRIAEDLQMSLKAVHLAKSRVLNALRSEATGLIDCS